MAGIIATSETKAQTTVGAANETATFVARVATKLNMNPQQQAALQAFEDLASDKSAQSFMDPDAFRVMSLPQKLDYIGDRAQLTLTKMHAGAVAAHHLYDLLSADQRKALDALMFPPLGSVAPPESELAAPASLGDQLTGHSNPDWLVKPTGDEIARVYPRAAQRNHVSGSALLVCTVSTDGYLSDCTVSSETPKDAGFGNAALEASAYMRMQPATNNGAPVESQVEVPVNFQF